VPDAGLPATGPIPVGPPTPEVVDLPFVGGVDVADTSLVTATVVIGFVDGVNPCSLWALSMLLAIVVHQASRRRVVAVGGTFLAVTTALYGLYLVGLYGVLSVVAYLDVIRAVVAAVALVLGLVNLKDGLGIRRGPSVRIVASAKPGLYRRMRRAAAGGSPVAVIGSTAVLAVGVSLLETPCTLGLPLLWTNLLAAREVGPAAAAGLFVLYMAAFLLDELVVFAAAVITLRATKVQERHGRALELAGGSLMVTLAAVLLVAPELLESVAGALAVLAGATLLAGMLLFVSRRIEPGEGGVVAPTAGRP
jgi:cytochrome c biogenesis protein CcdA